MSYTALCYDLARRLTMAYSTSFGSASRLFGPLVRPHIYAIYGMVRAADEIVDTYEGTGKERLLDAFQDDISLARRMGYSTNPLIHAFVTTAGEFGIGDDLVAPFFESMRMDLAPVTYDWAAYERYIYGSAEVVGLMCLKVFTGGDRQLYGTLEKGARALGSAYQKVNFLRDMKSDYDERDRTYFPGVTYERFDDMQKDAVIRDIEKDFAVAKAAIARLPRGSRRAVALSYDYYRRLLQRLADAPASAIKTRRIRVPDREKYALLVRNVFGVTA